MPRVATAARAEYEEQRKKDRRTPAYRKKVNARRRKKYAEDAQYRADHRAYQTAWRKGLPVNPSTRRMRVARGMLWTPEQEAEHLLKTLCEVCGELPTKRGLFADHCHVCRWYRGALCQGCNHAEGVLAKWQAVCPEGSPMRLYLDQHVCSEQLGDIDGRAQAGSEVAAGGG